SPAVGRREPPGPHARCRLPRRVSAHGRDTPADDPARQLVSLPLRRRDGPRRRRRVRWGRRSPDPGTRALLATPQPLHHLQGLHALGTASLLPARCAPAPSVPGLRAREIRTYGSDLLPPLPVRLPLLLAGVLSQRTRILRAGDCTAGWQRAAGGRDELPVPR